MTRQELKDLIRRGHEQGKKVAVCFCAHVPQEILEAAGFVSIRIFHISDTEKVSEKILPGNVCSVVKEVSDLCEDPLMDEVDLIIAETSCDGKKKMYELCTRQDKIYYYQIPQGAEREYVHALIVSEIRYFIKMLRKRFAVQITEEMLLLACEDFNREREALLELTALQKNGDIKFSGMELYNWMEEARHLLSSGERAAFYRRKREVQEDGFENGIRQNGIKRILVTGCPMSSVYEKVSGAIEAAGGVVVCFENCEILKDAVRNIDLESEDIISAIADCYQDTACAIMEQNDRRFALIQRLAKEYQVDGIVDMALTTCHSYTVEQYKMGLFSRKQLGIPYLAIETDYFSSDAAQIRTRLEAFLEMLC